jgi:peptidyl-dipeptidase Dcp
MRQELAEMQAIANQSSAPTFDNSIVAMERTGQLLTRVSNAFSAVTGANTNDVLQRVEQEEAPRRAAHRDEIYLNPRLFQRVKSIYDRRTSLGLDSVQQFLVARTGTTAISCAPARSSRRPIKRGCAR